MIGAGPGGQHRPRLRDPLRPRAGRPKQPTQTVEEVFPDTPAAAAACSPATGSRRRRQALREPDATKRDSNASASEVASHRCAGKQVDGCHAATPVTLTVRRDGEMREISVRPEYDAASGQALIGFGYGLEPAELGAGDAANRAVDLMWLVTSSTVTVFAKLFEEEQRKEVSGVVGVSAVANETIDVGAERVAAPARPGQPLARPDQPLSLPAARRRPHLLEPGREGARHGPFPSRSWSAPARSASCS